MASDGATRWATHLMVDQSPIWNLRTFGGLSLESADAPLGPAALQRKPLALLALLAVAGPRGVVRDEILLHLWPDSTPERARTVLRQTLYALRRDLTAPELLVGTDTLRINPAVLTSDVEAFGAALDRGDVEGAVALYRGPFLAGFELRESPEFERWCAEERRRLAERFVRAVEFLAARATAAGEHHRAVELWRRLAAMDPGDARAAQSLVAALRAAGDPEGAARQTRIYEAVIGQKPGGERERSARDAAGIATGEPPGSETPAPSPPSPREEPLSGTRTSPAPRRRAARIAFVLLATAIGIALGSWLLLRRSAQKHLDPQLLVIAPFAVFEPELELWREGLVDIFSRDLDGAGSFRTVSPTTVIARWEGRPDVRSAAEHARAFGAGTAVYGTVLRSGGDSVRVTATLVDAASSRVLAELTREDAAARMAQLTDTLAIALLLELHRVAGSTPDSISLHPRTSLAALKAFLRGEQLYRRAQWDSALAEYRDAVSLDSTYALAYRRIGTVLGWQRLTVDSAALQYLIRAGDLNHGLSPRDSLLIAADSLAAAANLTSSAIGQWRLTRRLFVLLENAVHRYPESPGAWFALGEAGYHFGTGPVVGIPEGRILGAFDSAIALDSGFAPAYIHPVELGFNVGGERLGRRYARRYLSLDPEEPAHRGVRLVAALVGPGRLTGAGRDRLLDTVSADALVSARSILRRWPDSAESAVLLSRLLAAGRRSEYPLFSDTAFMRRRLAQQLAFRGHLREAVGVLGTRELPLFAELAYLGAIPGNTAKRVFADWTARASPLARLALPWWALRSDTMAIAAFARDAAGGLRRARVEDDSVRASYDTAAATAHLFLARGDSSAALARFLALPDTLCSLCYLHRLVRARLLMARGRYQEAFRDLEEPLEAFLTPVEVVMALDRASAAAGLRRPEAARRAAAFALAAWMHADPELRGSMNIARQLAQEAADRVRPAGAPLTGDSRRTTDAHLTAVDASSRWALWFR
jgi:eukaryotic-like serine/threonine-protein kinase